MKKDIIKAYAKINLSLSIFGKNKNNFHKIQSVISFLDLHYFKGSMISICNKGNWLGIPLKMKDLVRISSV